VEEVGRLSDHVLADIGITRHQVGAIFALREPTRGMTEHAPIDGGLAIADRFGGMSWVIHPATDRARVLSAAGRRNRTPHQPSEHNEYHRGCLALALHDLRPW
jgi:hypothetical protein